MTRRLAWLAAAVLAMIAYFLRPGREWTDRNGRQADAEAAARGEAIDERRKRQEVEADAELEKKRSGSLRDRIAGALERASARLDRGAGR